MWIEGFDAQALRHLRRRALPGITAGKMAILGFGFGKTSYCEVMTER
jgi:hypothetical protein